MKGIVTGVLFGVLLGAFVVAQAELSGKWQGATRNGTEILLDLRATETAVAGTLTRSGQPIPIADGKVSKNAFTFKATFEDQTEGFTGELVKDEVHVWMDRQGREAALVMTRVKK